MRADTAQVPVRSAAVPARQSRGSRVDGRTLPARRAKALVGKFVAELGGPAAVTALQMLRIKRAAELIVAAERMRVAMLRGEQVDPLALVRLENLGTRAEAALGLPSAAGRPAAQSAPTFADIAAQAQADATKQRARELAADAAQETAPSEREPEIDDIVRMLEAVADEAPR